MARISKNRSFKLFFGVLMTFSMILSLFAGVGAIWVREETDQVYAEDNKVYHNGAFDIPSQTGELGSSTNPFEGCGVMSILLSSSAMRSPLMILMRSALRVSASKVSSSI